MSIVQDMQNNQWISVEDRLPDNGQMVLIMIGLHMVVAERCMFYGFIDALDKEALRVEYITHWQPLPPPPIK